jgi:hypothetical protein
MRFVVEPSAEDPEGLKMLDEKIRRAREKNLIEMEVFEIIDDGDEQAITSIGVPTKTVDEETYKGLERKRRLLHPDHPNWKGDFDA